MPKRQEEVLMKTVVGVFTSFAAAERGAEHLRHMGIKAEHINYLTPGASIAELEAVPTTDAEQPGIGKAIGGVVGVVAGATHGWVGAAIVTAVVPGVGSVAAIGLAAAALLGVGGAVAGSAAGGALENTLSTGLPKDELFVYEDALRQGRTVLIVLADETSQAEKVREVLAQAGAESLDAARERWWVGLRDVEAEAYTAQGWGFTQDEVLYRRGFEAAMRAETLGKPYEDALPHLQTRDPDVYHEEAFRRGYARGRAYIEGLREAYRG
jgi:hypothetical protein